MTHFEELRVLVREMLVYLWITVFHQLGMDGGPTGNGECDPNTGTNCYSPGIEHGPDQVPKCDPSDSRCPSNFEPPYSVFDPICCTPAEGGGGEAGPSFLPEPWHFLKELGIEAGVEGVLHAVGLEAPGATLLISSVPSLDTYTGYCYNHGSDPRCGDYCHQHPLLPQCSEPQPIQPMQRGTHIRTHGR